MMLKKLIPAAALLALTGAAQAQVSIYGLVDVGMAKTTTEDAAGTDASLKFGGNSATRVGLKGSTDLGSGIKGNFQLETSAINIDGKLCTDSACTSNLMFGRQAWVGASGAFGEVRAGRQDSVAFQTMIGFDLNGAANTASASGAAGIDGGLLFGPLGTRSVQYIAPTVAGFKVQLGYQSANTGALITEDGSKASTGAGVTYTLGNLALAATTTSKNKAAGDSSSAMAASYDFGVLKAAVNYSGSKGAKGTMYGVVAPVAGVNVGMQYAKNSDSKATGTEFFVNKEILKNTLIYADILSKKTGAGVKSDAYAVGVIYVF
jgi:predicted porin